MSSPVSIFHTVPHWFCDAVAWGASFFMTLVRGRQSDALEDLCQYGDAGAYRPDVPSSWSRR